MRAVRRLPSLRKQRVFGELRNALARTPRDWFRIVHFSVQADHVHFLVEADDKISLSRGMSGVAVRFARTINRVLGRHGSVWADRYHARALATPREVRHLIDKDAVETVRIGGRVFVTGAEVDRLISSDTQDH